MNPILMGAPSATGCVASAGQLVGGTLKGSPEAGADVATAPVDAVVASVVAGALDPVDAVVAALATGAVVPPTVVADEPLLSLPHAAAISGKQRAAAAINRCLVVRC